MIDLVTPELLLQAYSIGVFPMAERRDDPRVFWINPQRRGVIALDGLRVPRRLRRVIRQRRLEVRVNTAFDQVILNCAERTTNRRETWINDALIEVYGQLHRRGSAHSVECWLEGQLVGGLYGVSLGGAFFGESMFSRVNDASKVALVHLVARLRLGGFVLLDTQFVTEHLQRLGAREVMRSVYLKRLQQALEVEAVFSFMPDPADYWAEIEILIMGAAKKIRTHGC